MIKFFIKRKIKKLKKNYNNRGVFLRYEEMKNINVICDLGNLVEVRDFFKNMSKDGKKINLYCYTKKTKEDLFRNFLFCNFISNSDLNFFKFPSSDIVERFTDSNIDTVINISSKEDYLFSYLILLCPAKYKIAIGEKENSLYNLIISTKKEEKLEFFLKEMLFYIKNIRKK